MSQRKTAATAHKLIVSRDPEVMSGAAVFAGTRVPVQALIDDLLAGESINEFAEGYPTAGVEAAREFLRRVGEMIEAGDLRV
jgi:uncharacterized protein (DUF433 family)